MALLYFKIIYKIVFAVHLKHSSFWGPGKSTALLSAFATDFLLHFPLSAAMLLLRAQPQCYVSVLPAGGGGWGQAAERKVH